MNAKYERKLVVYAAATNNTCKSMHKVDSDSLERKLHSEFLSA